MCGLPLKPFGFRWYHSAGRHSGFAAGRGAVAAADKSHSQAVREEGAGKKDSGGSGPDRVRMNTGKNRAILLVFIRYAPRLNANLLSLLSFSPPTERFFQNTLLDR